MTKLNCTRARKRRIVARQGEDTHKMDAYVKPRVTPKDLTSTYHGRTHERGLDAQSKAELVPCKFGVCTAIFRCTTRCALRIFD